jgi:hypothetical protein
MTRSLRSTGIRLISKLEMICISFLIFIVWLASTGMASAQQPAAQVQCATKYEVAKAAGIINEISRDDFLKICIVSLALAAPASTNVGQQPIPATTAGPATPTVYTDPFVFCLASRTPDPRFVVCCSTTNLGRFLGRFVETIISAEPLFTGKTTCRVSCEMVLRQRCRSRSVEENAASSHGNWLA